MSQADVSPIWCLRSACITTSTACPFVSLDFCLPLPLCALVCLCACLCPRLRWFLSLLVPLSLCLCLPRRFSLSLSCLSLFLGLSPRRFLCHSVYLRLSRSSVGPFTPPSVPLHQIAPPAMADWGGVPESWRGPVRWREVVAALFDVCPHPSLVPRRRTVSEALPPPLRRPRRRMCRARPTSLPRRLQSARLRGDGAACVGRLPRRDSGGRARARALAPAAP